MPTLSPTQALWLADAILALHVGIVVFVVGLLPLVLIGGALDWRWVRHFGLRLTRYWLLSDHWSLDHAPCLENLLAVIAVVRSLGIWVLGRDVPMALLQKLEAGEKLIPEVAKGIRGSWHPEDLIDPLEGQDTAWRKALWEGAQKYLARSGVELPRVGLPADAKAEPAK